MERQQRHQLSETTRLSESLLWLLVCIQEPQEQLQQIQLIKLFRSQARVIYYGVIAKSVGLHRLLARQWSVSPKKLTAIIIAHNIYY